MIPVTLYTLKTQIVEADGSFDIKVLPRIKSWDISNGGIPKITHMSLPIHYVRRVVKPEEPLINREDLYVETEDHLFAVEPALDEILSEPYKHRLDTSLESLAMVNKEYNRLLNIIIDYNALPWWRRCWIAVTQGLRFV